MVSGLPATLSEFYRPAETSRAYARSAISCWIGLRRMLDAGWDELVRLLDEAHYVRFDFSTATKLLDVCHELRQGYGSMTRMIEHARTGAELSARLQEFKHIGPVTARIFTREVGQFGIDPEGRLQSHTDSGLQSDPRANRAMRKD